MFRQRDGSNGESECFTYLREVFEGGKANDGTTCAVDHGNSQVGCFNKL